MAKRPLFVPMQGVIPLVREIMIDFKWFPGMAKIQKQRSIRSLHEQSSHQAISPVLEVSSKSEEALGARLSAFQLRFRLPEINQSLSVEAAFQGSKVFERGGPFQDIYKKSGIDAKRDIRLKESGNLEAFSLAGKRYTLHPKSFFYDWVYINALIQHEDLCDAVMRYQGFTDIEFNPKKSINCQAYSVALFCAIKHAGLLDQALKCPDSFMEVLQSEYGSRDGELQVQGTLI